MTTIKTSLVATAALALITMGFAARAQSVSAPAELSPNCSSLCPPESRGLCHFALGMYFLRGITQGLPDCVTKQLPRVQPDGSTGPILRGIAELDDASRDGSGLQINPVDLQVIRAGGFIALSRRRIRDGVFQQSEEALSAARSIYHALLAQPATLTPGSIAKIAVGFIQAGAPLDAMVALQQLGSDDPQREYLMAEALFSVGDRMGAARQYSRWIGLKCGSRPIMLSLDEYGEQQWTYLPRKGLAHPSPCETLPQELRARLEALQRETPYLGSLPKTNDAPIPFPAAADH